MEKQSNYEKRQRTIEKYRKHLTELANKGKVENITCINENRYTDEITIKIKTLRTNEMAAIMAVNHAENIITNNGKTIIELLTIHNHKKNEKVSQNIRSRWYRDN